MLRSQEAPMPLEPILTAALVLAFAFAAAYAWMRYERTADKLIAAAIVLFVAAVFISWGMQG